MHQRLSLLEFPANIASWQRVLPYLFLGAVTSALYGPSLYFDFVWDDTNYILNNYWIQDFSLDRLRDIWTRSYLGNYAPLHLLTMAFLHSVWGLEPFGYHLAQLVLHTACVCLLYFVLKEIESPRIMYVPTSLTGSGRYGPYRDMHDCAYLQWQLHLLRALREVLPASAVTWKRHAKEHVSLSLPAIEGVKTSDQPFDQVIGDADVFVFDYVSSAFSQAAATDKPIILVEIGFRNIAPTAMNAIDARCIRVNADPARPVEALRAAIDRSAKLCVNTYTEAFSIAPGSSSRTESAASAIRSAVDQLGLVGKDSR